jgi:hypothetical protein
MPAVADVAVLAVETLIHELGGLQPHHLDRMAAWRAARHPAVFAARTEAILALDIADRLDLLESAAEQLAAACVQGQTPHAVRAAAYNALIALLASDLVPLTTFRALYESWEEGTHGGSGTDAVLRGEELLLTIG